MHYKSSFNAFILPCNTPYNARTIVTTVTNYQFIVTLCILNSVTIIYDKIQCITMLIMNNYIALYPL